MSHSDESNLRVLSFSKDDTLKKTKYDINDRGNTYHLKVDPCDRGFRLTYLTLVKKIDHTPEPLKSMVDPNATAYFVVHEEHVHEPNVLLRVFFGFNLEKLAIFRIKRMKRRFEKAIELTSRAATFHSSLEVN